MTHRPTLLLLLVLLLTSCRTQYVTVPEYHTEYVHRTDSLVRIDTIMQHDSVSVLVMGDTVRTEHYQWRDRIQLRYVTRTDTIIKTDSVSVPQPVERELTRYEAFSLKLGKAVIGWMSILAVIAALFLVRWLARKIRQ